MSTNNTVANTTATANTRKALPKLPSLTKAAKTNACECGCGEMVARRFVPGHDSRLKGFRIRVERGVMTLADIARDFSTGEAIATGYALGLDDAAIEALLKTEVEEVA